MSYAPSLTLALLVAASTAQVPDGHVVVASTQDPTSVYLGLGGLHVAQPRRPGLFDTIANVPAPLTGANAPGQIAGARSVLVLADGDLLVGSRAPFMQSIEIHRLRLWGSSVVASSAVSLGTGSSGGGGVAQMALVGPTRVLAVGNGVAGLPVLGGSMFLAEVDFVTGAVTHPLCWSHPNPAPNMQILGVAHDPSSGIAFFALHDGSSTGATTEVWSFLLGVSCTPTLVSSMRGRVTNLAWSRAGHLFVSLSVGSSVNPTLYRYTPGLNTTTPLLTGWDFINALAVEPATGEPMLCGSQVSGQASTGGLHWFDTTRGTVTTLANNLRSGLPRAPLAGVAAAPDPVTFGATSGPAPAYPWSDAPHPARLPVAGNAAFFVDVAWPNGSTPIAAVWAISDVALTPPVPILGFDLYVVPMVTGAMQLLPLERRSVLPLPIPVSLQPGAPVYLQTFHLVGSALHASEGLRVSIL